MATQNKYEAASRTIGVIRLGGLLFALGLLTAAIDEHDQALLFLFHLLEIALVFLELTRAIRYAPIGSSGARSTVTAYVVVAVLSWGANTAAGIIRGIALGKYYGKSKADRPGDELHDELGAAWGGIVVVLVFWFLDIVAFVIGLVLRGPMEVTTSGGSKTTKGSSKSSRNTNRRKTQSEESSKSQRSTGFSEDSTYGRRFVSSRDSPEVLDHILVPPDSHG